MPIEPDRLRELLSAEATRISPLQITVEQVAKDVRRRRLGRLTAAVSGGSVVVAALLILPAVFSGGSGLPPNNNAVSPTDQAPPAPTPTRQVLDQWRDFPAGRVPRPLVLLSALPVVVTGPSSGEKEALAARRFELVGQLPDAVPENLGVDFPEGASTVKSISASDAFRAMSVPTATGPARVGVTGAVLRTATFQTDRGSLVLPAWVFRTSLGGSIAWPAITPGAFWRFSRTHASPMVQGEARTDRAGTTMTIIMPAPPAACPGTPKWRYEPSILESGSAVVVGLTAVPAGTAPGESVPDCTTTDVLRFATYKVKLTRPLGTRVLVYADGAVIAAASGRA